MPAPPLRPVLVAATLAASLTACASPSMSMANEPFPPDRPNETQPGAKPPVPSRSPRAVPYEITLRIESAPGPFEIVRAAMSYRVENERCLPRLGGMSGTRVSARQFVEIELQRTGPAAWHGRFYDDLFVDEDYYGLGVCKWRLAGVSIEMRAAGSAGETRFSEFLFPADLAPGAAVTAYFSDRHYPRAGVDDFPASGERDLARFRPEARDRLFSLHAAVGAAQP